LPSAINRLSIRPMDNSTLVVSGKNIFKILSVKDNSILHGDTIKRLNTSQTFTDHCWLDGNKIALANQNGEIYIIYDQEVK